MNDGLCTIRCLSERAPEKGAQGGGRALGGNYLDPPLFPFYPDFLTKNRLYPTTTLCKKQRTPDWKSRHGIFVLALSLIDVDKNSLLITIYFQAHF